MKNFRTIFIRAGVLLGLGFGGFFDGIVFHQILQWHHMLTSAGFPPTSVENLQRNTLADGLFHALTYVLSLVGIYLLWRAARNHQLAGTLPLLAATMLAGWGAFNVVEGLVDHFLLQIHHVRDDLPPGPTQLAWDLAFLAWGAAMLIGGWVWARSLLRREGTAAARPARKSAKRG